MYGVRSSQLLISRVPQSPLLHCHQPFHNTLPSLISLNIRLWRCSHSTFSGRAHSLSSTLLVRHSTFISFLASFFVRPGAWICGFIKSILITPSPHRHIARRLYNPHSCFWRQVSHHGDIKISFQRKQDHLLRAMVGLSLGNVCLWMVCSVQASRDSPLGGCTRLIHVCTGTSKHQIQSWPASTP